VTKRKVVKKLKRMQTTRKKMIYFFMIRVDIKKTLCPLWFLVFFVAKKFYRPQRTLRTTKDTRERSIYWPGLLPTGSRYAAYFIPPKEFI